MDLRELCCLVLMNPRKEASWDIHAEKEKIILEEEAIRFLLINVLILQLYILNGFPAHFFLLFVFCVVCKPTEHRERNGSLLISSMRSSVVLLLSQDLWRKK